MGDPYFIPRLSGRGFHYDGSSYGAIQLWDRGSHDASGSLEQKKDANNQKKACSGQHLVN